MKQVLILTLILCSYLDSFAQSNTTFIDQRDNKQYKIVTIAEQTWFAENLAFDTKKGSWVYNKDTSNIRIYGRLYNWKTACTSCPSGWRLPSIEDYKILLKNINATDSLQWFNALIEGGKSMLEVKFSGWYAGHKFGQLGEHTDFWTTTVYQPFPGATKAPTRFSLFRKDNLVYWAQDFSDYGFSVRCIKE